MCRQVPAPSAAAWLIDLASTRGPRFVVLSASADVAREALGEYLVSIGRVSDIEEARELLADSLAEPVGVVW